MLTAHGGEVGGLKSCVPISPDQRRAVERMVATEPAVSGPISDFVSTLSRHWDATSPAAGTHGDDPVFVHFRACLADVMRNFIIYGVAPVMFVPASPAMPKDAQAALPRQMRSTVDVLRHGAPTSPTGITHYPICVDMDRGEVLVCSDGRAEVDYVWRWKLARDSPGPYVHVLHWRSRAPRAVSGELRSVVSELLGAWERYRHAEHNMRQTMRANASPGILLVDRSMAEPRQATEAHVARDNIIAEIAQAQAIGHGFDADDAVATQNAAARATAMAVDEQMTRERAIRNARLRAVFESLPVGRRALAQAMAKSAGPDSPPCSPGEFQDMSANMQRIMCSLVPLPPRTTPTPAPAARGYSPEDVRHERAEFFRETARAFSMAPNTLTSGTSRALATEAQHARASRQDAIARMITPARVAASKLWVMANERALLLAQVSKQKKLAGLPEPAAELGPSGAGSASHQIMVTTPQTRAAAKMGIGDAQDAGAPATAWSPKSAAHRDFRARMSPRALVDLGTRHSEEIAAEGAWFTATPARQIRFIEYLRARGSESSQDAAEAGASAFGRTLLHLYENNARAGYSVSLNVRADPLVGAGDTGEDVRGMETGEGEGAATPLE